jgi:hypothetical protein
MTAPIRHLDIHRDRHRASAEFELGPLRAKADVDVSTSGILAITGLVGVILAGVAGIVWASLGPARRRGR